MMQVTRFDGQKMGVVPHSHQQAKVSTPLDA